MNEFGPTFRPGQVRENPRVRQQREEAAAQAARVAAEQSLQPHFQDSGTELPDELTTVVQEEVRTEDEASEEDRELRWRQTLQQLVRGGYLNINTGKIPPTKRAELAVSHPAWTPEAMDHLEEMYRVENAKKTSHRLAA